jgi:hypothetical protein
MKGKPKVSKTEDGTWAYTLPAFGFAPPVVRDGFPSREAAGKALVNRSSCGSSSQLVTLAARERSSSADRNVPSVYR